MIINASTVVLTLVVVALASFFGLKLVRNFALQIAQENHDAVSAMDQAAEQKRVKQERAADEAAATAFAKVKPILTAESSSAPPSGRASPSSSPSGQAVETGEKLNKAIVADV